MFRQTETKVIFDGLRSLEIQKLILRLKTSAFTKQVRTLATGTLLAQTIGIAVAPLLTRLYEPRSFAVLALFTSLISIISPAVSGRYDIAMVVARSAADSRGLFVLANWFSAISSGIVILIFVFGQTSLQKIFNAGVLGVWWFLVPPALFVSAISTNLKYYSNRNKDYGLIGRVVVAQAVFGGGLSVLLGIGGYQLNGLLISNLAALFFSICFMGIKYHKEFALFHWVSPKATWKLACRYRQFPLFNSLPSLLDNLTVALPVFFLNKFFSENIVGYYALLTRAAATPLAFISQSVSQVHIRKVAELVHVGKNSTNYLLVLSLVLALIISVPTLVITFFGPYLFSIVFGVEWRAAGELLAILMPAIAVRFVVSTVSGVFSGTGNNHLSAGWKILAFLVTFSMFWVLSAKLEIKDLFFAMLITDLFLYSVYFYLILYAVNHPRSFN